MAVDTHEIPFDYEHSLTNWKEMGYGCHFNLFTSKKNQEQSNFTGIEYVFQGIKCTCKNVSWKRGSYFTAKKFI